MAYNQIRKPKQDFKKLFTACLSSIVIFAFTLSARAEVRVVNTARCIFGSVVLASQKVGIKVKMNGSCAGLNKGIEAVSLGKADVGTLARDLTAEEEKKGLLAIPLTFDGMAVMVNKGNPVKNLTYEQILHIMAGKIKNWKEVGGYDKKIMIISHSCGASEKDYISQLLADSNIIPDEGYLAQATLSSDITDNVISKLKRYNTAISFAPPIFYTEEIGIIKINGYLPTRENIFSGKYPLRRQLNLVTMGQPVGDAKKFVSFMTGFKGMALIEENLTMDWCKERFLHSNP